MHGYFTEFNMYLHCNQLSSSKECTLEPIKCYVFYMDFVSTDKYHKDKIKAHMAQS